MSRPVVPPVQDTIDQVKLFLQRCGGTKTLSTIGGFVKKPKSRKLLQVVRSCPDNFVVRQVNQEHIVQLVSQKRKTVPPPPVTVVPKEERKESDVMEQATKRLKSESLTPNEIIHSFKEHEITANDLSGLEVAIQAISNYPNHHEKPIFVGLDFRREFAVGGRVLPSAFLDVFIGKSRFTFEYQLSPAPSQYGLQALLSRCQQRVFFTIANPRQLWEEPFGVGDQNPNGNFNLLDSQLVAEYLFQEPYLEWENILGKLLKMVFKTEQLDACSERERKHLFFHLLWEEMLLKLREQDVLLLQTATRNRMLNVQQPRYGFGFESGNGYSKHSNTLAIMATEYPAEPVCPLDFLHKIPLEEENDFNTLFECMPQRLLSYLNTWDPTFEYLKENITEIVLDIGRRPYVWVGGRKIFFCNKTDSLVVEQEDIDHILDKGQFRFGPDNRATVPGQLHRIAAMRDRNGKIYGLTLQFGRHVKGNAGLILDFLHGTTKSILILGPPGSGKTTLVREIARVLSEGMTTCVIVDPSNEIGGDDEKPHPCIGLARRMMVPSLEQQGSVMVECVQNHSPHVMIIDEIGRSNEVVAAEAIKNRGVRLVASAHGDLRGLLANSDLNGLIGGVQAVTLGDGLAQKRASTPTSKVEKVVTQRVGQPIFDVIIELDRSDKHVWKVIAEPCEAVDAILNGGHYSYELRSRNPETFEMSMVWHADG